MPMATTGVKSSGAVRATGEVRKSAKTTSAPVTSPANGSADAPLSRQVGSDPNLMSPNAESSLSPTTPVEASPGRRPGKRPAARGTAFYPRKRANTACQVCRARKTKCDNLKPTCSYCLSVGAACIQSPVDLSSFDPASLKILQRLDELESTIQALASNPPSQSSVGFDQLSPSQISVAVQDHGSGPGRGELMHQVSHIQGRAHLTLPAAAEIEKNESEKPTHHRSVSFENGPEIISILPQRIDDILLWPAFFDAEENNDRSPAPCEVPPDALSSPLDSAASSISLADLESARLYQLLDDFFLHIHCKNPILDEVSTREIVLDAFHKGMDWSPASCLAMLICALGCIATPFGPSDNTKKGTPAHDESQALFHAAQRRIGTLLVRSDIIGAQCLFLSGIYLMMVFQPIYAWRFFSQALAACQHLPFLAKAQTLRSSPSAPEMRMCPQDTQQQAVYWSAWKSERELRHELDLPDFVLSPGHTLYPPFFPAPPAQPANPSGVVPGSEAARAHSSWMFYLAEISLRRLTSRLSSELIGLRDRFAASTPRLLDVLADMMPEYEAQVQEWSNSLPADLSLANALDGDGICRSVLRGRMINLLEMIYWPFVMAAIGAARDNNNNNNNNSSSSSSSSNNNNNSNNNNTTTATGRPIIAPAAEELARRGLDTHVAQIDANRPGFRHRHHGGYFMIRSCTRSALVLVAAARAGCAMPPSWSEAIPEVIGMLSYWEDEDADVPRWKATLERALAWRRGTE